MREDLVDTREDVQVTVDLSDDTRQLWVGDPCYALGDDLYDHVIYSEEFKDCKLVDKDGKTFGLVKGTYDGDGDYDGMHSHYPVDAGLLAVIDYSRCDGDNIGLGWVFNVPSGIHRLRMKFEGGTIRFWCDDTLLESIDTYPLFDDDEEEDGWDDDDEY